MHVDRSSWVVSRALPWNAHKDPPLGVLFRPIQIRPGTPLAQASNDELEERLHRLTDQLMQQQRTIERLTADNSSLALRLETEQDKVRRTSFCRLEFDFFFCLIPFVVVFLSIPDGTRDEDSHPPR
jgi:hypothetical protein